MDLKQPLTISEQVQRLKDHEMIIEDANAVKSILLHINYYRFTGYALQFRQNPSDSNYLPETTFTKVYHIYCFDEELRTILRKYIEKLEVYFRTLISYTFSIRKCMNPPHDQHYDEQNYYKKMGFHEILSSFKREQNYYKDSLIVQHHHKKYMDKMPLWVIVELMSFSNLSKLYNSMYSSEQDAISSTIGIRPKTLMNHLHCLSVLRNKCAHAGRLYNTQFSPPVRFNPDLLQQNKTLKNNSLFAYILLMLKRLPETEDKYALKRDILSLLNKYSDDINLSHIGFIDEYRKIMNQMLLPSPQ